MTDALEKQLFESDSSSDSESVDETSAYGVPQGDAVDQSTMGIVAQQPSMRLNLNLADTANGFPQSQSIAHLFYNMPDYSNARSRLAIAENHS